MVESIVTKKVKTSGELTVSKGNALLKKWEYPWDSKMAFDDIKSSVVIKLGNIVYIVLGSQNSGLLIERPDYDKLVIRMACNTDGFIVGKYQYSISVFNYDGSVFMQESGEISITDTKSDVDGSLPEVTSQRPWNMPYKPASESSNLPGQDEFDKELEASLDKDS